MGKVVKKVGKGIGKVFSNPVTGALAGGAVLGPGGALGGALIGSGALGGLGLGSDSKQVVTNSTQLNPEGLAQFNFAGNKLQGLLGGGPIQALGANFGAAQNAINGINFGGINSSIGALQGFTGTGAAKSALGRVGSFTGTQAAKNAVNRVGGFTGTQAAKNALNQIGAFRGTSEAFRTLGALEDFGAAEQGFVTDARNAVLSFDEGFQSQALPLLQQAAEGQFLTEQGGNPFIRDLIDVAQRPVVENFNEQVLPGILSTFAGTGGVGSSLRAGFTAQNARDLQRTLGDISTNIGFNVFESERAKQLAAQQAILGFEGQGLDRQLAARTTNLDASQQTAQLLLAARQAAGGQATQLSQQRLAALQAQAAGQVDLSGQRLSALQAAASGQVALSGQQLSALQAAASGQVALSGQRQAALAAALQGKLGAGQLKLGQGNALAGIAGQQQQLNISNAQLKSQQIAQLLQLQQNAGIAGQQTTQNLIKPGLF